MTTIVLDTLGILAVGSSVLVITAHSPVASVMWLIAVFVLAALYLVSLGVTFVGLTYLVVYVGAVAVLFLFVVMMLNVRLSEVVAAGREYTKNLPLGLIVGTLFLYEILAVAGSDLSSFNAFTGLLTSIHNIVLNTGMSTINDVHIAFSTVSVDTSFTALSQVQVLGLSLYTYNSLVLLFVSLVLLLAMLGPIALCLRTSTQDTINL